MQLVDLRVDRQPYKPCREGRSCRMDTGSHHEARIRPHDRRFFDAQRKWIDAWNTQDGGVFRAYDEAVELARTERPRYISVKSVGLLMSEVDTLTEYLNEMDRLGYGIQRMPTEDFGPHGKVVYFIRKD
jgi:hypothetical protein